MQLMLENQQNSPAAASVDLIILTVHKGSKQSKRRHVQHLKARAAIEPRFASEPVTASSTSGRVCDPDAGRLEKAVAKNWSRLDRWGTKPDSLLTTV
jgi:hypothetical protein